MNFEGNNNSRVAQKAIVLDFPRPNVTIITIRYPTGSELTKVLMIPSPQDIVSGGVI